MTLLGGAVGLVLAHRLRQRRQSAARARLGARARDRRARRARRAARPHRAAAAAREPASSRSSAASSARSLAMWALAAISRLGPPTVPWIETLHLDWRALAFAGASCRSPSRCSSGILPAWRVARAGLANAGRNTTTADVSQHRLRAGLVVAEVALALVLVSGAGAADPQLRRPDERRSRVSARSRAGRAGVRLGLQPDAGAAADVLRHAIARLAALPAVQHAGAVSAMPFIESNINIQNVIAISGRPHADRGRGAARVPVGRHARATSTRCAFRSRPAVLLDARDGPDSKRVAVISEALARRYWAAGDDPDRRHADASASRARRPRSRSSASSASLRHDSLDRGARDELFMPLAQMPFGSMTFVVPQRRRCVGAARAGARRDLGRQPGADDLPLRDARRAGAEDRLAAPLRAGRDHRLCGRRAAAGDRRRLRRAERDHDGAPARGRACAWRSARAAGTSCGWCSTAGW